MTAVPGEGGNASGRRGSALVAGPRGCFFSGVIDDPRQVAAPEGWAWLIDLTERRGPVFVVLCRHEQEARAALAVHLVDAGTVSGFDEAVELLEGALPQPVGVVW